MSKVSAHRNLGWTVRAKLGSVVYVHHEEYADALMDFSIRLVLLDVYSPLWRSVDHANLLFDEPTIAFE